MITVHHLENSRSQRVLWLLEELGLDFEIKRYERDKTTNLAPRALLQIHPLGKSPVIEHDGRIVAETGAIIEHLVDGPGGGRLKPQPGTDEFHRYRYWLHAGEGSYMPPLVIALILTRMETAPAPFFVKPVLKRAAKAVRDGYLTHTTKALFEYADKTLRESAWFAGDEFSAADIMMSFPLEAGLTRIEDAKTDAIKAFVERIHARPAYQEALRRGGPYIYA